MSPASANEHTSLKLLLNCRSFETRTTFALLALRWALGAFNALVSRSWQAKTPAKGKWVYVTWTTEITKLHTHLFKVFVCINCDEIRIGIQTFLRARIESMGFFSTLGWVVFCEQRVRIRREKSGRLKKSTKRLQFSPAILSPDRTLVFASSLRDSAQVLAFVLVAQESIITYLRT